MSMIPKDLLPIIGAYVRPSIKEYCRDLTVIELRDICVDVIDMLVQYQDEKTLLGLHNYAGDKVETIRELMIRDKFINMLKLSDDMLSLPIVCESQFSVQDDEAYMYSYGGNNNTFVSIELYDKQYLSPNITVSMVRYWEYNYFTHGLDSYGDFQGQPIDEMSVTFRDEFFPYIKSTVDQCRLIIQNVIDNHAKGLYNK